MIQMESLHLFLLVLKGHVDVARFLLEHGSSPDVTMSDSVTALMFASKGGFTELVKLLLEAGADPNLVSKDGFTAMMMASRGCHSEIVKLLLSYNADFKHTTLINGIPYDSFVYACSSGSLDIILIFLKSCQISNTNLSLGWLVACLFNQSHLIEDLINSLPEVSSDKRKLVAAFVEGDLVYIKSVVRHPDGVEFVHGVTPLMVACSCDHSDVVKALLDAGASVSRSDEFGYKAVDYCEEHSPIPDILNRKEVTKRTFNIQLFFLSSENRSHDKGISNLSSTYDDISLWTNS